MKYFISTLNFSSDSREKLSNLLPRMKDVGLKNIEISSLHPYEEDLKDLLVEFSKKYKLSILLHNFAPPTSESFLLNLCSKNDFLRLRVKRFVKRQIDLTKKLGGDYFSFHAGFRVKYRGGTHDYKYRISDEKAMNMFIHELRELLEYAEEKKVHLGVENHIAMSENKNNLILYGMNNWKRMFDEIKSEYLHLHLDIGHLKVTAAEHNFSRDKFIEKFGEYVMAIHVHDNTGIRVDGHAPFSKELWFGKKHFKHLNNLKYIILETKTYGNMDLINGMIKILEMRTRQ